jgi:hypothetical protein
LSVRAALTASGLTGKIPRSAAFVSIPFKRRRIAGRLPNVPASDVHCVIGCAGGQRIDIARVPTATGANDDRGDVSLVRDGAPKAQNANARATRSVVLARGGSIAGIRSCTSATNLFGAYLGFSGDELSQ